MSPGKKLAFAISPLIVLSLSLVYFGYESIRKVQEQISEIPEFAIISTKLLHEINTGFDRQVRFYEDTVFMYDASAIDKAEETAVQISENLRNLKNIKGITKETRDRLDCSLKLLKTYTASAGAVYRQMSIAENYLENPENAKRVSSLGKEKNHLETVFRELSGIVRQELSRKIATISMLAKKRNNMNALLSCLVIILSLVMIYLLIEQAVTKPMMAANWNLQKLADALQNEMALAKEAKEAAETANLAKSTFLASMSHELRTPLNVILGIAQLMTRETSLAAEHRKELETINRSGEHLLSLINDVLDLSKIESGKLNFEEQDFDLYHMLDVLEDMFRLKAEKKNLSLIFSREPDIPRYIKTDKIRLRQVLINLLGNAVKFTDRGTISLWVTLNRDAKTSQESRQKMIHFEIEDTGPGIDSNDTEFLFVPFMQAKAGLTSREGTGLGLALSRKYVQLMGGEIDVSSSPGKGSLFRFNIRVRQTQKAFEESSETVSRRVKSLAPGQPVFRILVADDKADNRHIFVKLLNSSGFEVREAENGAKAVEIWKTWDPHLIWMDIRMPVTDGCEATRIIRRLETRKTPIIAVSASIFEDERAVVKSAGCDDFVAKPVSETQIFDMMQKHIRVRYIYEDSDTAAEKTSVPLTAESLSVLPSALLVKLKKAAGELDPEMIRQTIDEIRQENPELADGLSVFAENYEYDKIVSLIYSER
jgi:signal transduction histidine kinase/DNA-binding response OmpR family regulator